MVIIRLFSPKKQTLNDYLVELIGAIYDSTDNANYSFAKAEDLFEIHIGKTPPRKQKEWFTYDKSKGIIWESIKDMGSGQAYLTDSSEYLIPEAIDRFNIKKCPKSSVLLSFKLTVGRVGIVANEMVTNEAIACFKSDDKAKLAFLFPYLRSFDYSSLGSTSSIATAVNSKTIKAMPIKLPKEEVLEKLYRITIPLYKKILNNQREIDSLVQIRDSLLPKLMSGEIDVSDIKLCS